MYARFLPIAVKQQMAMILGGVCGVLTLIGGAGLLWRHLTNQRVRATSTTPDIIIAGILARTVPAWLSTIRFGAISGWQRNDEVGGLGAKYCHLPRRVFGNAEVVWRLFSAFIWLLGMTGYFPCSSRSPVWFMSGRAV